MPEHLSEERLKEIERRANAATPGPYVPVWESCDCGGDHPCSHNDWVYALRLRVPRDGLDGSKDYHFKYSEVGDFTPETMVFIAHAREDIPALISALRAEREEQKRLVELLRQAKEFLHSMECLEWEAGTQSSGVWRADIDQKNTVEDAIDAALRGEQP